MVTFEDEKGKIFTQVIGKQPVNVTIQTTQQVIRGSIYIRPSIRIKDELNEGERFLAVTDAIILDGEEHEILRAKFMVVNVDHIIWIMPQEEPAQ
jgi:hypothetical protein